MIVPMVAKLVKEPFDRDRWRFELKWDVIPLTLDSALPVI
jgi:hypothetical protein